MTHWKHRLWPLIAVVCVSLPPASRAADPDAHAAAAAFIYPRGVETAFSEADGFFQMGAFTSDDVPTVLAFYEKVLGETLQANCVHGGKAKRTSSWNESRRLPLPPDSPNASIPVIVRVLTQSTDTYWLSVVLSQSPGEKGAHIVLVYGVK